MYSNSNMYSNSSSKLNYNAKKFRKSSLNWNYASDSDTESSSSSPSTSSTSSSSSSTKPLYNLPTPSSVIPSYSVTASKPQRYKSRVEFAITKSAPSTPSYPPYIEIQPEQSRTSPAADLRASPPLSSTTPPPPPLLSDDEGSAPPLSPQISNSGALRILDSIIGQHINRLPQNGTSINAGTGSAASSRESFSAQNYVMVHYDMKKERSSSLSMSAFGDRIIDDLKRDIPDFGSMDLSQTLDSKRLSNSMSLNILHQNLPIDHDDIKRDMTDPDTESPDSLRPMDPTAYVNYAKRPMKPLKFQYKNSISWTSAAKHNEKVDALKEATRESIESTLSAMSERNYKIAINAINDNIKLQQQQQERKLLTDAKSLYTTDRPPLLPVIPQHIMYWSDTANNIDYAICCTGHIMFDTHYKSGTKCAKSVCDHEIIRAP